MLFCLFAVLLVLISGNSFDFRKLAGYRQTVGGVNQGTADSAIIQQFFQVNVIIGVILLNVRLCKPASFSN